MADQLLVVSEYFSPDEASTGRLLGDLIREMDRLGSDTEYHIFTSNRLYRGKRDQPLPSYEREGNIHIRRFASHRSGKDGFVRRLWSDVAFSLQVASHASRKRYGCVMAVTNPPLLPLLLSFVLSFKKTPFIYLIHDLYPDVPVALGVWRDSSMLSRVLRYWQSRAVRKASRIIVLGRCMRNYLMQHYGVAAEKISVIPNWATVTHGAPEAKRTTSPFEVVYSGNLGRFQDFDTILDAADLLRDTPVRFRLVGNGARLAELRETVHRRSLANVSVEPFLPEDEFRRVLETAALGVVSLEPQLEGLGVPSKTYNLLAAGVPVLAIMGDSSEVSYLINEVGCGIRVNHGESEPLAQLIRDLVARPEQLERLSTNGSNFARAHLTLQTAARRYLTEIAGVTRNAEKARSNQG